MMSTEWLGDQIREMLHPSIITDQDCHTQLVANFCGTYVYDASSCWGRFWSFIWNVIHLFDFDEGCRQQALYRAVRTTYEIWTEKKEEISQSLTIFRQFFARTMHAALHPAEVPVEQEQRYAEEANAQKQLIDCMRHIGRAFQEEGAGALEQKIAKIQRIFRTIAGVGGHQDMFGVMTEVEEAHSVLKLQQKIKMPYPLSAFTQLASGQELSQVDVEEMSLFVEKLLGSYRRSEEEKRMNVRELHTALRVIISYITDEPKGVARVEWPLHCSLLDQGCCVFFDQDREHYQWASQYAHGETRSIFFNGKELKIGSQISTEWLMDERNHLVFENDADTICMISLRNLSSLRIEWMETIEKNYGLPLPELVEMGEQCALYERLPDEAAGVCLLSQSMNRERQLRRLHSVVHYIQKMLEGQFTPEGFSSRMVRFNKNDCLTFLKFVPKGEFNWDAIHDFVLDCTNDYPLFYFQIMAMTGLGQHPVAKKYQLAVSYALFGEERLLQQFLETEANSELPRRELFLGNADNYCRQARDLKASCLEKVMSEYVVNEHEELARDMAVQILDQIRRRWGVQLERCDQRKIIHAVLKFCPLPLKNVYWNKRLLAVLHWFGEHGTMLNAVWDDADRRFKFIKKHCQQAGIYHLNQIVEVERQLSMQHDDRSLSPINL